MLAVLSPAKSLDMTPPPFKVPAAPPVLMDDAEALMKTTKNLSQKKIRELMNLSEDLAKLNYDRFRSFELPFTADNAMSAGFMFNGDVYRGLDFRSLKKPDVAYAEDHLAILSGLYGVLRPTDLMQPYRLEMGTKLSTRRGKNLYAFWGDTIAEQLNTWLEGHQDKSLINLASNEYFKAVKPKALRSPVVTCIFEDWKTHPDEGKVISFLAKMARGMMARFIIEERVESVAQLKDFDKEGYSFRADRSSADTLVFSRKFVPIADRNKKERGKKEH